VISQIPLTTDPNQTFSVTIPGDTKSLELTFTLSYNTMSGYWVLGIYDSSENALVLGIPLLPDIDLLEQYKYMGLGTAVLLNIGDQSIAAPDDENLSSNFALMWEYEV